LTPRITVRDGVWAYAGLDYRTMGEALAAAEGAAGERLHVLRWAADGYDLGACVSICGAVSANSVTSGRQEDL